MLTTNKTSSYGSIYHHRCKVLIATCFRSDHSADKCNMQFRQSGWMSRMMDLKLLTTAHSPTTPTICNINSTHNMFISYLFYFCKVEALLNRNL